MVQEEACSYTAFRGPPLYMGGGAGVLAWPFLFTSQGRLEALFFHLSVRWKYLFQYLYYIFSTSFVDKIFISTIPCGHLFISPIFHKNIYLKKLIDRGKRGRVE